jgi:hypothetical protein
MTGLSAATGPCAPRAAAGTDLTELDRLVMSITIAFEARRYRDRRVAVLPGRQADGADVAIVDVSSAAMIAAARQQSAVVDRTVGKLEKLGISSLFPGSNILTVVNGEIDRMIELNPSGVDAQEQAMSWNEWKTAQGILRDRFWLYLVGNLRADLRNAIPNLRAIHDPFGTLSSVTHEETSRSGSIQIRVREFAAAGEWRLKMHTSEVRGRS